MTYLAKGERKNGFDLQTLTKRLFQRLLKSEREQARLRRVQSFVSKHSERLLLAAHSAAALPQSVRPGRRPFVDDDGFRCVGLRAGDARWGGKDQAGPQTLLLATL